MISRVYNAFSLHKSFPDEICACIPLTTVKMWGTFLVAIPRHQSKQAIDRMIQTLTENYWYAPTLLYASWKEWFIDHGVQTTQYLKMILIFHLYYSMNNWTQRNWNKRCIIGYVNNNDNELLNIKNYLNIRPISFDLLKEKQRDSVIETVKKLIIKNELCKKSRWNFEVLDWQQRTISMWVCCR